MVSVDLGHYVELLVQTSVHLVWYLLGFIFKKASSILAHPTWNVDHYPWAKVVSFFSVTVVRDFFGPIVPLFDYNFIRCTHKRKEYHIYCIYFLKKVDSGRSRKFILKGQAAFHVRVYPTILWFC